MTVRELIEKLSRMTANMQEMEVYTYTNPHQMDEARPSPAQLQNRIKVINL